MLVSVQGGKSARGQFECPHCGRRLSSQVSLENHRRSFHTPTTCDRCPVTTTWPDRRSLKVHGLTGRRLLDTSKFRCTCVISALSFCPMSPPYIRTSARFTLQGSAHSVKSKSWECDSGSISFRRTPTQLQAGKVHAVQKAGEPEERGQASPGLFPMDAVLRKLITVGAAS